MTENQPTDGKVIFEGAFPVKGRYTLYTQFNVNGSIKTFPITVDVNEVGEAKKCIVDTNKAIYNLLWSYPKTVG